MKYTDPGYSSTSSSAASSSESSTSGCSSEEEDDNETVRERGNSFELPENQGYILFKKKRERSRGGGGWLLEEKILGCGMNEKKCNCGKKKRVNHLKMHLFGLYTLKTPGANMTVILQEHYPGLKTLLHRSVFKTIPTLPRTLTPRRH